MMIERIDGIGGVMNRGRGNATITGSTEEEQEEEATIGGAEITTTGIATMNGTVEDVTAGVVVAAAATRAEATVTVTTSDLIAIAAGAAVTK